MPRRLYEPILPKSKEWPVVRLSKNRAAFINEVADSSYQQVLDSRPDRSSLREELETTMYREFLRIKGTPWKVDPQDEREFWDYVKSQLVDSATNQDDTVEKGLLKEIIRRYANEIAGNFKSSRYRLARSIATAGFRRLLNAAKLKTFAGALTGKHTLHDKIQITGEIDQLRNLATKGTIIIVPTHFSNLDSVLIAWAIYELGLPPFIYGAGLNLFNIGLFAYFMNSVGAYKVDRRKKNQLYLTTLKTYSTLAIQRGCHSLFFPGGTRSRSGKIETGLKLGLLGTAIEAQRKAYQEAGTDMESAQRIYVVPVTLNYNFVLEAPVLIRQYLERKGQERFYYELDEYSTSYKILTFLLKFFTREAKISVSIGRALNIVGNYVDFDGQSIDKNNRPINTSEFFMTNGTVSHDSQREQEYTRMLSGVIVKEYLRINKVMPSHLVAFVAFRLLRNQYPKLDIYNFFRIPEEDLRIAYEDFKETFTKVHSKIMQLHKDGQVDIADHLNQDVDEIIQLGIKNVGMYHTARPLIRPKNGDIRTQDLHSLYYYHNRMEGYDLEDLV